MKKVISVLLTVLILGLFTCFALGSGEDNSSVSEGDGTTAAAQSEQKLTANVGDTLTTESLKITYTDCKDYTGLSFSVENVGSTDRHISYFDFECYADDAAAEAYYAVDDGLSATLSAGRKTSGNVYFEVPKDAQSIEVEYETDFWSGNKAIFVVK